MTKEEICRRLDWAQAALQATITEIQTVLKNGREHLVMDDADWLCRAIEEADEARHSILDRGPYPRLSKEIDYDDEGDW